jgi:heat shock protein HslJ
MLVRRRLSRLVSGASILLAGAACADRRALPERDSSGARSVRDDPEAAFRARLGQTWELARLGDQDIPPARTRPRASRPGRHPGPGSRPTLRFTAEPATAPSDTPGRSSAGGWSFCNGYGTAYEFGPGDRLRFHGFQSTLVGCDGPDSLETRFFRALHLTQRFELDSTTLSLVAADGSRITFVPAPDSASPPAS